MKTLDCPVHGLMYAMRAVSPALASRLQKYLSEEERFSVSSRPDSYFYSLHRRRMPGPLDELRDVAEFFQTDYRYNWCEVRRSYPGQGLPEHTIPREFEGSVVVFTLQAGCEVVFRREGEEYRLYTEPWSMYILTGDAVSKWTRSIETKMVDDIGEKRLPRTTRYEVEYRSEYERRR